MGSKAFLGLAAAMLLGFCPIGHLPGHSLEDLIGPEQAAAILAGEKPLLAQFRDPRSRLSPRHDVLRGHIEAQRRDLDPSVMVETLHIYQKPQPVENAAWSAEEEARLYNNLLALSSLAGLQYYSASRGSMRIFYETSFVIDGPSSKNPLPDPAYARPQAEIRIYARQKDLTFGDNIYQYDYYTAPGAIIFVQQNLTPLTVGIIPAVGKDRLRSVVAVFDAGNYLLVYAASMARAVSFPGMNDRLGNSFANRAEAVIQWFSAQADRALGK